MHYSIHCIDEPGQAIKSRLSYWPFRRNILPPDPRYPGLFSLLLEFLERLRKASSIAKTHVKSSWYHNIIRRKRQRPNIRTSDPESKPRSEVTSLFSVERGCISSGHRDSRASGHRDSRASDRRDSRASCPFEAEQAHDTSSPSPPFPYELSPSPWLSLPSPGFLCPASHAFVALSSHHRDRPDAPC